MKIQIDYYKTKENLTPDELNYSRSRSAGVWICGGIYDTESKSEAVALFRDETGLDYRVRAKILSYGDSLRDHLSAAGAIRSEKKAAAARENGKRGGRPRGDKPSE